MQKKHNKKYQLQEFCKSSESDISNLPTSKSAEEVQSALQKARERLRGAREKRDQAMQRLAPENLVTPISALSANLVINNIAQTGTEDQIYFPTATMGLDLGRNELELEQRQIQHAESLVARKRELQKELHALEQRLELQQKQVVNDDAEGSPMKKVPPNGQVLSRQALEKKKEEAQTFMDCTYWKHFVSKQEDMLVEAQHRVLENKMAIEDCEAEHIQTTNQIEVLRQHITEMEHRQFAVLEMISKSTSQILFARQELHHEARKPNVSA